MYADLSLERQAEAAHSEWDGNAFENYGVAMHLLCQEFEFRNYNRFARRAENIAANLAYAAFVAGFKAGRESQ